jgi:Ca2+-binding RTX toxin-like protein
VLRRTPISIIAVAASAVGLAGAGLAGAQVDVGGPIPVQGDARCRLAAEARPGANVIVGTEQADLLLGGPGVDVIDGLGGGDTILARGDNDVVCGGDGIDTIDPVRPTTRSTAARRRTT